MILLQIVVVIHDLCPSLGMNQVKRTPDRQFQAKICGPSHSRLFMHQYGCRDFRFPVLTLIVLDPNLILVNPKEKCPLYLDD